MNLALSKNRVNSSRKDGVKAVFIDRDGVVNKDPGGWTEHSYVTRWKDFHFLPGALEALRLLNNNDIKVIVISNQAGVSKGYFSKEKLDEINAKMLDEVNKNGGSIEEVFYCIHKDEDRCNCRKPKTALFEIAAKKYGIKFKDTYFIGDSQADVIAGNNIGCRTIFLLSGKTSFKDIKKSTEQPDYIFENLLKATQWLLNKEKTRAVRLLQRRR